MIEEDTSVNFFQLDSVLYSSIQLGKMFVRRVCPAKQAIP